ncbi:HAUS augmin-like complex subunit 6 [Watersipora subatra]|uniref:HAUS augmin-like complex subunit 6 n=1 Tax=Watersipora subatra TaxID=2589382 RepID=UPI00355B9DBF
MSSAGEKRQVFYTNMLLLGFDGKAPSPNHFNKVVAFNVDMFKVPNKSAFEVVIYFLFTKLSPSRAKEEFRDCWPILDKKREQMFRRVCNGWLSQIAQNEPDAHLPKIVPSVFQSPGGDRFCHLIFAFSTYVLTQIMKQKHGVKEKDMLRRPLLTPQNMDLSSAMTQALYCSVIEHRQRFFERIQIRESLHKSWQKSASVMVQDYRRLSKDLRQSEAEIEKLLAKHADKGFSSPVRRDGPRKNLSLSTRHGRVFDTNIESVNRKDKVKKVRELWHTVEGFLASSVTQQEVVSSILSGVVNKYVLDAAALDLRVPEMLLRECERELLKRDIGNTYKAGKLDLLSILHLWNLSMHLYLEKFEEADRLDLTNQLKDLQPKVHGQHSQLQGCRELARDLHDRLIPELKESVRDLKSKHYGKEQEQSTYGSKLGMSLQPLTPPLVFDSSKVSEADLQSTQLSFTPTTSHRESTPEALSRILKSVNKSMQPQRLACKDLTNQAPDNSSTSGPILSPLAQGRLLPRNGGEFGDLSFGESSRNGHNSPAVNNARVQVSRVGSKQMTRLLKDRPPSEGGVFSPDDTPDGDSPVLLRSQAALSDTTPTSVKGSWTSAQRRYQNGRSCPESGDAESPSDVLAARIAQTIIEVGDVDRVSPTEEQLSKSLKDSEYSLPNVLDELGVSGFVKRDKIGRTPDTSMSGTRGRSILGMGEDKNKTGKVIFASHVGSAQDAFSDEENIITVDTLATERSSYSDASSKTNSSSSHTSSHEGELAENSEFESPRSSTIPTGSFKPADWSDMERSLRGQVFRTPECARRLSRDMVTPERAACKGRELVHSVLDEQPLFIDSPMAESFQTEVDADLLDLLPYEASLHESSGFVPSSMPPFDLSQNCKPSGVNRNEEKPSSVAHQDDTEDLIEQYRKLKEMTTAATANQYHLSTAANQFAEMVTPTNQKLTKQTTKPLSRDDAIW